MKNVHCKGRVSLPILATSIILALAFTFTGCGGDDPDDPNNPGGNNNPGGVSCDMNYRTVNIGSQTWMADNLNCNVSGSVCYGNDDANCAKYGRLYDWATAMGIDKKYNNQRWGGSDVKHRGICPSGWHIPNKADWDKLINYVENDKGCTDCAGKYLKATSGWNSCGPSGSGNSYLCEDTHGFSALPGGGRSGGSFDYVGYGGYWWSSYESSSDGAYFRYIYYNSEYAHYHYDVKDLLFSVRCVQD
jgi:uncharacterized protein (TIGR02145 family)